MSLSTHENKKIYLQKLIHKGRNNLTKQEVTDAIRELSFPPSDQEILFQMMDKGNDESVTIEEFSTFVRDREETVQELFELLDSDQDRYVEVSELMGAFEDINNTTDVHLENIIRKLEIESDRDRVDLHEFSDIMMSMPTIEIRHVVDAWSRLFDMSEENVIEDSIESPLILLTAGGIAGAVSRTATAPLDRLKVLYQAGGQYTSLLQACRSIMTEGGMRAFYKGNGTNVIKIAPETAIKFWAYENLKKILNRGQEISLMERFTAGAMAGGCAQFCVYPLEITKTRLALAQPGEYHGIMDCLTSIVKKEGPRALFKGLLPALSGIAPYAGVDLAVYSWLKDRYTLHYPYTTPGALTLLSCGALSSTCGQVVAYPLVVIRTRLQAQGMLNRPIIYHGMTDCFQKILQKEGIKGFYRGIVPNFMKAVPAISISYLVYEKSKIWINKWT